MITLIHQGLEGRSFKATFAFYALNLAFLASVAGLLALVFGTVIAFRATPLVAMVIIAIEYAAPFLHRWLSERRTLTVMRASSVMRVVSVLFADIRGFTAYSEQHSTRQVAAVLNDYFTAIVPLIAKHGGILMQHVGDGIMVLFGASEHAEGHPQQAVQTAVAIVRRVHELHHLWERHDFRDFRIGVGIHTGSAIVSTVGSPRQLDYTAIGDVVNAAARIKSENKRFETEILISSATYHALPRDALQSLGGDLEECPVEVKSKNE